LKIRGLIFGVGALLAAGLVQGGPPFVTDDPEPPPTGGWGINVPFILERTPGKAEMDAPLLDFNYGLPDVQLNRRARLHRRYPRDGLHRTAVFDKV